MEKRGWLRVDSSSTPVDEIRLTLKRGKRLTTAQLVELIDNPGGLMELGHYAGAAEAQLSALGDVKAQAAPTDITAYILDAYQNEPEAVERVAHWVNSILPSEPVGHAYVATRLLLGVPANIRKYDVPRMQRVLMNCRQHQALAGQWKRVKQASLIATVYRKQTLDL